VLPQRLEAGLREALSDASPPLRGLLEPLVVTRGGKRLRPFLVFAAGSLGVPDRDALVRVAVAIELVHAASLVHDDLMDRAASRRGMPTLHHQHGAKVAALAGGLLFQAASTLAQTLRLSDPAVEHRLRERLAQAAEDAWRGQAREFIKGRTEVVTPVEYLQVIEMKTARLFQVSCEAGALASGGDSDALAAYGRAFGMLYQLGDDLRDLLCTVEELGKPPGSDIREGVFTLPIILYAAGSGVEAGLSSRLRRRDLRPAEAERLRLAIVRSSAITACLEHVDDLASQARRHARALPHAAAREALEALPGDLALHVTELARRGGSVEQACAL
jgi:geranylgeranyl pyrophosphate synthase